MSLRKRFTSRRGQTMVEYIIIVVVIAIAGLVLFGIFGDTLKKKMSGAVSALDTQKGSEAQSAANVSSRQQLQDLDASGSGID
jgi:Flp pilus assembly pilin Flp